MNKPSVVSDAMNRIKCNDAVSVRFAARKINAKSSIAASHTINPIGDEMPMPAPWHFRQPTDARGSPWQALQSVTSQLREASIKTHRSHAATLASKKNKAAAGINIQISNPTR